MYQRLRVEASAKADRLRERLRNESISWEVRIDDAHFIEPPLAMARFGRYADLCVIAAPKRGADDRAVARAFFSALLFESGRPILVVPANAQAPVAFRRIVVAWSPTREATRALHDALPLAAKQATLDICIVDPLIGDADHGGEPGADIATHLARHDANVTVTRRTSEGQSIATAILIHAAHANAQLVVAGGYGHSRLREWMLGGTTRDLLSGTDLPILFAH
jgi:nucleotide-binding universal stress UspA family protein